MAKTPLEDEKEPEFYIPEDFSALLAEIDATARAQGEWEGRMLSCYVACQEAYEAGIVNVPQPSERIKLGKKLAALMKAAKERYAKATGVPA